jgi:DNA-binding response OmpR family regulator
MQGKAALVVVARARTRQTIARALARVGWRVSVAASGVDAVRVARAESPDLVVVDADLGPSAAGVHPATALRRSFGEAELPRLVLVASRQDDAVMQLAGEARASRVVVVPLEDDSVQAAAPSAAPEGSTDHSGPAVEGRAPSASLPASSVSVPAFEDVSLPLLARSLWVVDDSHATRVIVRGTFERAGWLVREFSDLGSAHAYSESHEPPQAIVLDIHLPDGNGLDHVRRFARSGAAVVMVSNLAGPDQVERAFAAGAADVVSKPFDLRSLVARVEKAVRLTPAHVVSDDVVPAPFVPHPAAEPAVFLTNWG